MMSFEMKENRSNTNWIYKSFANLLQHNVFSAGRLFERIMVTNKIRCQKFIRRLPKRTINSKHNGKTQLLTILVCKHNQGVNSDIFVFTCFSFNLPLQLKEFVGQQLRFPANYGYCILGQIAVMQKMLCLISTVSGVYTTDLGSAQALAKDTIIEWADLTPTFWLLFQPRLLCENQFYSANALSQGYSNFGQFSVPFPYWQPFPGPLTIQQF